MKLSITWSCTKIQKCYLDMDNQKRLKMNIHCIDPTVPTWSPALCRTRDRFEFWICFYFQTRFQSWSSWSHVLFFLFLLLQNSLKIFLEDFSWRFFLKTFLEDFPWRYFLEEILEDFFSCFYDLWACTNLIFLWSEMHKEMPRGCFKCYAASELPSLISSSNLSLLWGQLACPLAERPRNTKSN